jgi:hypothetical protein
MPASGGVQRAAQPGQLVRTQAGQPAGTPRTLSDPADGMSRRLTFSDSSIANREPAGMTDLNSSSTETTTSPRRHRRPAEAGPGACFPGRRLLLVIAGPEHRQAGRYRDGRHGAADGEPRPDARAGRPGTRRGPASTRRRTRSPSPAARCRSPLLTRVRPTVPGVDSASPAGIQCRRRRPGRRPPAGRPRARDGNRWPAARRIRRVPAGQARFRRMCTHEGRMDSPGGPSAVNQTSSTTGQP